MCYNEAQICAQPWQYCQKHLLCYRNKLMCCASVVLDVIVVVLLSSFQCLSDQFPCRIQPIGSAPMCWSNPHTVMNVLIIIPISNHHSNSDYLYYLILLSSVFCISIHVQCFCQYCKERIWRSVNHIMAQANFITDAALYLGRVLYCMAQLLI